MFSNCRGMFYMIMYKKLLANNCHSIFTPIGGENWYWENVKNSLKYFHLFDNLKILNIIRIVNGLVDLGKGFIDKSK